MYFYVVLAQANATVARRVSRDNTTVISHRPWCLRENYNNKWHFMISYRVASSRNATTLRRYISNSAIVRLQALRKRHAYILRKAIRRKSNQSPHHGPCQTVESIRPVDKVREIMSRSNWSSRKGTTRSIPAITVVAVAFYHIKVTLLIGNS